jgi:hypothetical protein
MKTLSIMSAPSLRGFAVFTVVLSILNALVILGVLPASLNGQILAEVNLALNPQGSGYPSPLESDRGWGGGSYPWQITDGLRSYPDWPHGLAFTGGHNGSGGSWVEPAGPRQATINFGEAKTFNKVILWHHGDEHVPAEATLAYWAGSVWTNIAHQKRYDSNYVSAGSGAKPETYTFAAVTGSKVRYSFDNSSMNILGTPIIHGWLYEMEVFNDNSCEAISISSKPQPQTIKEGGPIMFSVGATGTAPITYQWRFNGAPEPGANSATFSLPNARMTNSGIYSVVLSNCAGTVVGGEANLVVMSGTNQGYTIGQIPDLTVWVGQTLEFSVYSEDLENPSTFFASSLTAIQGALSIDATTGRFSYAPSPDDKRTFTVRFVVRVGTQTKTQDVKITPQQHLPAEQASFGLVTLNPLPDAESDDYIIRYETTNDTEVLFNTQPRHPRSAVLIGKDLVFQYGHPNHLLDSYNDTADIKSFVIYAERIFIRNELRLPQTEVIIHAREIILEDPPGPQKPAAIITAPRSITTRAASANGTSPGQSGIDGHPGGRITLYVESIRTTAGTKRFIVSGGNGQPAGLGRSGIDGRNITPLLRFTGCRDIPFPDGKTIGMWFKQTTSCTGNKCNDAQPHESWIVDGDNRIFKAEAWPASGTDAVSAGKPGEAGEGGDVLANVDIASLVENRGGIAGDDAPFPQGGRAGTPSQAFVRYQGCEGWSVLGQRTTTNGIDGVAPQALAAFGSSGTVMRIGNSYSWLTPYALRLILAHAKDAYLSGHFDFARSIFSEYSGIIERYSASPAWQSERPEWQTEFTALSSEIQTLLHRISAGRDYFGNPAGWAPMLSFEANFSLFRSEIEPAIRTLYLSYWIGNAATDITNRLNGLAAARSKLAQEIEQFRNQYREIMDLMPGLELESISISSEADEIQRDLDLLEQSLLAHAQQNVEDRHKVPGWKKDLKLAGAIMSVIPAYQPALGAVGQGLNIIADYNGDNLLETAEELSSVARGLSPSKLKESMENWQSEMAKINPTNFTLKNSSYLTNLTGYGKALEAGYKVYREVNTHYQAPANEVEAELARLKASNPEFESVVNKLSHLMAKKELFARKLADVIQAGARLNDGITHDFCAIDGMNIAISQGLAVLDERALSYLKEMERRAKERLIKYHYYLAKSYEYRLLKPYLGELRLDALFESFRRIVELRKGHDLDAADFEQLRAIYEEQLSSVVQTVVETFNSNPPERSLNIPLAVPPSMLSRLGAGQPIRVNLKNLGYFLPSEENLRLADLQIDGATLGVSFSGARFPFKLHVVHSGISRLSSDGENYHFRHYNDTTRSPLKWGIRYNEDRSISPEAPSDATRSLLYALLSRNGQQDNILLFARPGVDADFEVSLEAPPGSSTVAITNLSFRLGYDYSERRTDIALLTLAENSQGLAPYYILSKPDLNQRQDGRGAFQRTFRLGDVVTIEAPVQYEKMKFVKWTDGAGNQLVSVGPLLQLRLTSDKTIRAQYTTDGSVSPPDPGRTTVEIRIDGNGSVSGLPRGGQPAIGSLLTLNAIPGPGSVFAGWSGSTNGNSARLTLVVTSGLVLHANFVRSPFRTATWGGLFYPNSGVNWTNSGKLDVRTGDDGSLRGVLNLAGKRLSFRGNLDLEGKATATISRTDANSLTVRLALDFGGTSDTMLGQVTDGSFVSELLGDRAVFHSVANHCPFQGRYIVVLPGDGIGAERPGGDSFATLTIDAGGMAKMVFTLADGSVALQRAPVSRGGHIPVYTSLYQGHGLLMSWLTFSNMAVADIFGSFAWEKPERPTDARYPFGFRFDAMAIGSALVSSNALLEWTNGVLVLTGGGLPAEMTTDIALSGGSGVSLNPRSGLFRGVVKTSPNGQPIPYKGAILQKQNRGSGFFIIDGTSGRAALKE